MRRSTRAPILGDAARRALFDEWAKFAYLLASRLWGNPSFRRRSAANGFAFDDVKQFALMGLWHATSRFDPARGVQFGSYSTLAIIRRAYQGCGLATGRKRRAPFRPLTKDPAGPDVDLAAAAAERLDRQAQLGRVRDAARDLPPAMRAAFLLHLNGCGRDEIARLRGLSPRTVPQYLRWAESRIRDALAGGQKARAA